MRLLLVALAAASSLAVMAPANPAHAWYDRWGRWHAPRRYYGSPYYEYRPQAYYDPRVYVGPPPAYVVPPPPHYRPPPVYYAPY